MTSDAGGGAPRLALLDDPGAPATVGDLASGAAEGLVARCAGALLRDHADGARAFAFRVPGRVEVLGKHTDYAGGRSLVAAAEPAIWAVAVARGDRRVVVRDVADGVEAELELASELEPGGGWVNYPATVVRRVARNFAEARTGATIAFGSTLPAAAGLSSSSALVIAVFAALAVVNDLARTGVFQRNVRTAEELAGYLGSVENGRTFGSLQGDLGVGTRGGSQDHTAILCSRPGQLARYAWAPARLEAVVELPDRLAFAVAASGVLAEKTGAARERYNRASELMSAVAELWRAAEGVDATPGEIVAAGPEAVERLLALLDGARHPRFAAAELRTRFEQFAAETGEIVPAAADALARGDLAGFARAVERSQALAEEKLGNQVPETVALVRGARELGALAASAFGAGFGGSVWALVEREEADRFLARWHDRYRSEHPGPARRSVWLATACGAPAARIA